MMLDYYDRLLPAEARAAVRGALDPKVHARLTAAAPLEWLPAEVHMCVLPAPLATMDADAYRALWRGIARDGFDRPLFRSFVHGVVTAFGSLKGQVFRMLPRGFGLIARDCGEMDVAVRNDDCEVDITWRAIPPVLRRENAFPIAWAGTMEAVLEVTETNGSVTLQTSPSQPSRAHYTVRW